MTATMDRFPFGAPSTRRPPRQPSIRPVAVSVVGVYPSALHVRWDLPRWAIEQLGLPQRVGALAVDVEPTVFWDGTEPDPFELSVHWREAVGFAPGDEPHLHGSVRPVMNGTSGRSVAERILQPLGVAPAQTFFTDVMTRFYIKSGSPARPEQADRIREVYEPFAREAGLPSASLPPRPSTRRLVADAVTSERNRLRGELAEASAPTVVTLGEEARAVIEQIADDAEGSPTRSRRRGDPGYGQPGRLHVGGYRAQWYALTHPGNRNSEWAVVEDRWAEQVRDSMGR